MIDTHAHLDPAEAAAVLERARLAGVNRVITVATTIAGCHEALALARGAEGVAAVLGVHPHEADAADAGPARRSSPSCSLTNTRWAVGETGLDYFRGEEGSASQRRLFDAQLALAAELALPVVIHSRDADTDTLAALAGYDGTVVLHCFSSPGMLERALERRFYISFAGNVTYPNAGALRDAARLVPAERLLAETDSPYLAPVPLRGQRNEPAHVVHTLAALAQVRGEDERALGEQIVANAVTAFSL